MCCDRIGFVSGRGGRLYRCMALGLACASTVQHTNSVELGPRPGVALRVQSWIVSFYSPCAAPRAYTSFAILVHTAPCITISS